MRADPAYDLEAEQRLLGAILVDCEAAQSAFELLQPEDFYSPRHARIFGAMVDIYKRWTTVDEVLVHEYLERTEQAEAAGGLKYLDELIERLPAGASAEYYARRVQEKALVRQLRKR